MIIGLTTEVIISVTAGVSSDCYGADANCYGADANCYGADVTELMVHTLLAAKSRVKLYPPVTYHHKQLWDKFIYHYFLEKMKNNTYSILIRSVWR